MTTKPNKSTNNRELKYLRGHTSPVYSVAKINETTIISGSNDNTVRVWDVDIARENTRKREKQEQAQQQEQAHPHPDGRGSSEQMRNQPATLGDIEHACMGQQNKKRTTAIPSFAYDFYKKYLWKELSTNGDRAVQQSGLVLRTIYCQFGNWCVRKKYCIDGMMKSQNCFGQQFYGQTFRNKCFFGLDRLV